MIYIQKVNEETFAKVVKMKVAPGQEKFVASNVYSLAQAWLYYSDARPFAIINEDEPVGFLMIDWDEDERTAGIWRFMIDSMQQHKGFGRAAILATLDYLKKSNKFDLVHLDFVPTNTIARELYYSVGFRENGKIEDDEIVMTMPLTNDPKVGMTIADEEDIEEIKEFLDSEQKKDIDIPNEFTDYNKLIEAINNENIFRLTIMGEIIGLSDGINMCIGSEYEKYYCESLEKVKEK